MDFFSITDFFNITDEIRNIILSRFMKQLIDKRFNMRLKYWNTLAKYTVQIGTPIKDDAIMLFAGRALWSSCVGFGRNDYTRSVHTEVNIYTHGTFKACEITRPLTRAVGLIALQISQEIS